MTEIKWIESRTSGGGKWYKAEADNGARGSVHFDDGGGMCPRGWSGAFHPVDGGRYTLGEHCQRWETVEEAMKVLEQKIMEEQNG